MPGVIAFDPSYAKPLACAYRNNVGELMVDSFPPYEWGNLIDHMDYTMCRQKTEYCVIEGGHLGKNPRVALKLAEMRGGITAIASTLGYAVAQVPWRVWVPTVAVNGYVPQTSNEAIQQAQWHAKNVHGLPAITDDEAVAVALCVYGESQVALAERTGAKA